MGMSQLKERRDSVFLEVWASFGCSGSMTGYDKSNVSPLFINPPISLAFYKGNLFL